MKLGANNNVTPESRLFRGNLSLQMAKSHAEVFLPSFLAWLELNPDVFAAFESAAVRIHQSGRGHYSARRIAEGMRHDSPVRDSSRGYKIHADVVPDCARLFCLLHPECGEFFTIRGRQLYVSATRQLDLFGVEFA